MQEAKPGNKVGVRYKGWLAKTNKVFDQTKGSKTFNFRVGVTPCLLHCHHLITWRSVQCYGIVALACQI